MNNEINNVNNSDNLYPVGTVCKLKNRDDLFVVIIGFYPLVTKTKITQYMGCFYPYGMMGKNESLFFNSDEIEKVLFEGYKTPEDDEFKKKIISDIKPKIENKEFEIVTIDEENTVDSYREKEPFN